MIFRFITVWLGLHIILFFVERYRYKHGNWSWYGFWNNGMLHITYFVLAFDKIGGMLTIISGLVYWIFQPNI